MLSRALLGWLATTASLVAFGAGFVTGRTSAAYAGLGFALPVCLLAAGAPLFRAPAWIALASTCVATVVFSRGRKDVAFALLLPFAMLMTVLAVFALRGLKFTGAF